MVKKTESQTKGIFIGIAIAIMFISLFYGGIKFAEVSNENSEIKVIHLEQDASEGETEYSSCQTKTCGDYDATCGNYDNGCSGIIRCGECDDGYSCDEGECILDDLDIGVSLPSSGGSSGEVEIIETEDLSGYKLICTRNCDANTGVDVRGYDISKEEKYIITAEFKTNYCPHFMVGISNGEILKFEIGEMPTILNEDGFIIVRDYDWQEIIDDTHLNASQVFRITFSTDNLNEVSIDFHKFNMMVETYIGDVSCDNTVVQILEFT